MKNFRTYLLIGFLSLIAIAGCTTLGIDTTIKEGGVKLTAPELESLVTGHVLHMEEYGNSATVAFREDGRLAAENSQGEISKGRWDVDVKDRLCMKFKKWGMGENCYEVYKVGDEYRQFNKAGLLVGSFTVASRTVAEADEDKTVAAPEEVTDETKSDTATDLAVSQPPAAQPIPTPTPTAASTAKPTAQKTDNAPLPRNCPGCDLSGRNLQGAELLKAHLPGANLTGANLRGANLKMANLKGASLVGANLAQANLAGADLAGADLTDADLSGAELYGTNLKGATLNRVKGADFMGAIR